MRILGHIHTLNDDDVIDRSLGSLLNQTHPLDGIVLVDNGSTDNTLSRVFPKQVTVVRHVENLGTSGAVVTGFTHALTKGYDWIWILDGDSAPRKDALEKLVGLYRSFPEALQARTWLLASLPIDVTTHERWPPIRFTPQGPQPLRPDAGQLVYEFDAAVWTGSLYKLAAVREVGLPSIDYVLDWGEYDYGYQGKLRGYRAFMHEGSILDHNIDGQPGPGFRVQHHRLGPLSFKTVALPPIRSYYVVRNGLYFWLHVYYRGNLLRYLRNSGLSTLKLLTKLLLLAQWSELRLCLRALRDGFFGRMRERF